MTTLSKMETTRDYVDAARDEAAVLAWMMRHLAKARPRRSGKAVDVLIRHIGRRRAFLLSEDLHAIRDMVHDEIHHGDKKKKKQWGRLWEEITLELALRGVARERAAREPFPCGKSEA